MWRTYRRIGARQEQRIEKRGETGMEIRQRIELRMFRRADEAIPRPQNSMELSREGELILDVLDDFECMLHRLTHRHREAVRSKILRQGTSGYRKYRGKMSQQ